MPIPIETLIGIPTQQGSKNAAMTRIDTGNLSRVSTDVSQNGRVLTTTYVLVGSTPYGAPKVIVRREWTGKAMRNSIRLIATATVTDDDDNVYPDQEWEGGIFWNHPGNFLGSTDVLSRVLQCTASLALDTFDGTTGVPVNLALDQMNFNVVEIFD